ncbi:hypothetical protein D3C86_1412730 [compost metagenome]
MAGTNRRVGTAFPADFLCIYFLEPKYRSENDRDLYQLFLRTGNRTDSSDALFFHRDELAEYAFIELNSTRSDYFHRGGGNHVVPEHAGFAPCFQDSFSILCC